MLSSSLPQSTRRVQVIIYEEEYLKLLDVIADHYPQHDLRGEPIESLVASFAGTLLANEIQTCYDLIARKKDAMPCSTTSSSVSPSPSK